MFADREVGSLGRRDPNRSSCRGTEMPDPGRDVTTDPRTRGDLRGPRAYPRAHLLDTFAPPISPERADRVHLFFGV